MQGLGKYTNELRMRGNECKNDAPHDSIMIETRDQGRPPTHLPPFFFFVLADADAPPAAEAVPGVDDRLAFSALSCF